MVAIPAALEAYIAGVHDVAVDVDAAFIGRVEPAESLDQRQFAGTVSPTTQCTSPA
jgi:hypothetical protein